MRAAAALPNGGYTVPAGQPLLVVGEFLDEATGELRNLTDARLAVVVYVDDADCAVVAANPLTIDPLAPTEATGALTGADTAQAFLAQAGATLLAIAFAEQVIDARGAKSVVWYPLGPLRVTPAPMLDALIAFPDPAPLAASPDETARNIAAGIF